MDLAQTVSHLAAANLELTNVHKRTLGYLEAICLDNHHSRKIKRKTKRKVRKRDELQTNEVKSKIVASIAHTTKACSLANFLIVISLINQLLTSDFILLQKLISEFENL